MLSILSIRKYFHSNRHCTVYQSLNKTGLFTPFITFFFQAFHFSFNIVVQILLWILLFLFGNIWFYWNQNNQNTSNPLPREEY